LRVTVNSRNYDVYPLPPYLVPISTAISELTKKEVKTTEEAKKNSEEIKRLLEILMKECVEPQPDPKDIVELYRYAVNLVSKAFDDVDKIFFPSSGQPQGSAAQHISEPGQAPKRDPEAKAQ